MRVEASQNQPAEAILTWLSTTSLSFSIFSPFCGVVGSRWGGEVWDRFLYVDQAGIRLKDLSSTGAVCGTMPSSILHLFKAYFSPGSLQMDLLKTPQPKENISK